MKRDPFDAQDNTATLYYRGFEAKIDLRPAHCVVHFQTGLHELTRVTAKGFHDFPAAFKEARRAIDVHIETERAVLRDFLCRRLSNPISFFA